MSDMQAIQIDISEIHLKRSQFLDAFAELECVVIDILLNAEVAIRNVPFGQKLEAFRKIEKCSRIAKSNFALRDKIADKIAKLLTLRADIVHSVMRGCMLDGMPAVRLVNALSAQERHPLCRILTERDFASLAKEVAQLTSELRQLGKINPASSPQPPSQP